MSTSIDALAAVLTTALCRGHNSGFDMFHPIMPVLHESTYPFAAARAIELIKDWGITMNDSFRKHVNGWIEGYNELPSDAQQYIVTHVNWAWSEKTTYENPILYWKRLGHKSPFGKPKSFQDIHNDILARLPKEFTKPYEE